MIKRIVFIVLAAVIAFALVSCAPDFVIPKGTQVSCEKFSAVLPEGWFNYPYHDVYGDDKTQLMSDALLFCKGTAEEMRADECSLIIISCSDLNGGSVDMRDMYENTEDVILTVNGMIWNGYLGTYGGVKNVVLERETRKCKWSIAGYMEAKNSSYTLDDEDFRMILASLTLNQ